MKKFDMRIGWGVLLIAGGILFLLQNMGFLGDGLALLWGLLFGVPGVAFVYMFVTQRSNWWAAIPGVTLLSIGALIVLEQVATPVADIFGGGLIMGGIGLAFWLVYISNRGMWWAVIPAGVMTSLTCLVVLEGLLPHADLDGVLLIGFGLTFALLSILPTPKGRMWWAVIPAVVLVVIGFGVTPALKGVFAYIWPAALILTGLYFLYRTFQVRGKA
ncbi:MAG: hypothetical protein AB1345_09775 [Chloroflexota bacterium]